MARRALYWGLVVLTIRDVDDGDVDARRPWFGVGQR